jgi:hypothetical protein
VGMRRDAVVAPLFRREPAFARPTELAIKILQRGLFRGNQVLQE